MQNFIGNQPWPLLLKASWQAAVLIVLVLAAQFVLRRRLAPRWRYRIWLLVVLRPAMPWTVPSAVSLFNVLNFSTASEIVVSRPVITGAIDSAGPATVDSAPTDQSAQRATRASAANAPRFSAHLSWLPLVWAVGALAMALGLAATHYRFARRVTPCRPLIVSGFRGAGAIGGGLPRLDRLTV
jgi:beta-lactamase regulating signal transducer with metallopeptidase domain